MASKPLPQIEFDSHNDYEYMGYQSSGDYKYHGYKQYRGTNWKICREDTTDNTRTYVYGDGGWATAWASPGAQTYAAPPDN